MSANRSYLLAYHPANFDEAGTVKHILTKAGYEIAHLKSNQFSTVGDFAKVIDKSDSPLILLISDNFLRSAECLYGFFDVFKNVRDSRELVIIICEGKQQIGNDFEQVKTNFKKIKRLDQISQPLAKSIPRPSNKKTIDSRRKTRRLRTTIARHSQYFDRGGRLHEKYQRTQPTRFLRSCSTPILKLFT